MNKTITRTLCILLALVLMSSSAVSSTFAEYARSSELIDNSRSSIWGVNLDVAGSAFATKYVGNKTYAGIDLSVKSSSYGENNAENILAPGTTGTFTGITCTGRPEVSVQIEIDANLQLSNWTVGGEYYCPLIITINGNDYYGMDYNSSGAFISAIEEAIESASGIYAPNTDLASINGLNGSYQWFWDFTKYSDDEAIAAINAKDTALQGRAAIALSVSCSVYQVGADPADPDPTPDPDPDPDEPDDDDGLTDDGELDVSDKGPIIWF